jgi:glycosidase
MTLSMPTLRRLLTLCLAGALASPALTQTLARPGWAGSGMSTDVWWKHAVVYELNPANFSPTGGTPIHGVIQRLDYIHSLGADAILLTPIQPDPAHAQSIDPALGTSDDLDDLIHEASRINIRVLLDLDPNISNTDLPNVARFWLNRGIAGFHVVGINDNAHAQAVILRKATSTFLGQRILIADADPASDPRQRASAPSDSQTPQLLLDPHLSTPDKLLASTIRPIIDATQDVLPANHPLPLLATDGPTLTRSFSRYADGQNDVAIAKLIATLLFATHGDTLLYYGQELGVPSPDTNPLITWDAPPPPAKGKPAPPVPSAESTKPNAALQDADPTSLLNWYRQLSSLHHGNAAIASGTTMTINQDDKNVLVWIRKPQATSPLTPPLVIICNLTTQPVNLSLKADITRLHLRGSFLRTILRSDKGMGTMHLESMTIAPYATYIGALRF